jgi:hypothetical protein
MIRVRVRVSAFRWEMRSLSELSPEELEPLIEDWFTRGIYPTVVRTRWKTA